MNKKSAIFYVLAAGAATGFINGLFGGGGGMIVVPAMIYLLNFRPHEAHATAISVILPISAVSAALYAFSGAIKMAVAVPVTIGVFAGGFLGAKLMDKVSGRKLTVIFCLLMLVAGIRMVIN